MAYGCHKYMFVAVMAWPTNVIIVLMQEQAVVPWHQDTGYLEPESANVFQPTAWIPLVDGQCACDWVTCQLYYILAALTCNQQIHSKAINVTSFLFGRNTTTVHVVQRQRRMVAWRFCRTGIDPVANAGTSAAVGADITTLLPSVHPCFCTC
jgi:hypothetical protein